MLKPRKPMSARERAFYEHQKRKVSAIKQKKRARLYLYAARISLMALVASILFAVVLTVFLVINFSFYGKEQGYELSVYYDGKEVLLKHGTSIRDGVCYVSLSDISELLGFKTTGGIDEISALFDNDDKITFYLNTNEYSVNGVCRTFDGVPYLTVKDGEVHVPLSFVKGSFSGITLHEKSMDNNITATLKIDKNYSVLFSDSEPIDMPDMSGVFVEVLPENDFLTDLSAYEQYMNPADTDAYIKLINSTHTLSSDYIPDDLINISYTRRDGRAIQQMREAAAKSLDAMFIEMYAYGYTDVTVTSAYRSYNYQQQLFNNKLSYYRQYYDYDTAYARTAKENAVPGTSEHQSGLCADLHNLASASGAFEAEEAYDWLVTHCADFGFILRYPKDKQDITQIIFEPWHYRFVGRFHAQQIMRSKLSLEEYCELNGIGLD